MGKASQTRRIKFKVAKHQVAPVALKSKQLPSAQPRGKTVSEGRQVKSVARQLLLGGNVNLGSMSLLGAVGKKPQPIQETTAKTGSGVSSENLKLLPSDNLKLLPSENLKLLPSENLKLLPDVVVRDIGCSLKGVSSANIEAGSESAPKVRKKRGKRSKSGNRLENSRFETSPGKSFGSALNGAGKSCQGEKTGGKSGQREKTGGQDEHSLDKSRLITPHKAGKKRGVSLPEDGQVTAKLARTSCTPDHKMNGKPNPGSDKKKKIRQRKSRGKEGVLEGGPTSFPSAFDVTEQQQAGASNEQVASIDCGTGDGSQWSSLPSPVIKLHDIGSQVVKDTTSSNPLSDTALVNSPVWFAQIAPNDAAQTGPAAVMALRRDATYSLRGQCSLRCLSGEITANGFCFTSADDQFHEMSAHLGFTAVSLQTKAGSTRLASIPCKSSGGQKVAVSKGQKVAVSNSNIGEHKADRSDANPVRTSVVLGDDVKLSGETSEKSPSTCSDSVHDKVVLLSECIDFGRDPPADEINNSGMSDSPAFVNVDDNQQTSTTKETVSAVSDVSAQKLQQQEQLQSDQQPESVNSVIDIEGVGKVSLLGQPDSVLTLKRLMAAGEPVVLVRRVTSASAEFLQSMRPCNKTVIGTFEKDRLWQCTGAKVELVRGGPGELVIQYGDDYSSVLERVKELRSKKNNPRIVVCGGKNKGKSTLCRHLVNYQLSKLGGSVGYLDLDLGQCEFTVPGCLTYTLLTEPLLSPPCFHLDAGLQTSVFLGCNTPSNDVDYYVDCLSSLLGKVESDVLCQPLLVNTMGWTEDAGLNIMATVIAMIQPDLVIQINSLTSDHKNYPPVDLEFVKQYQLQEKDVSSFDTVSIDSTRSNIPSRWGAMHLRNMATLAYFSPPAASTALTPGGHLPLAPPLPVGARTPYAVSWDAMFIHLCQCSRSVSVLRTLDVLNGSLVNLSVIDPAKVTLLPDSGSLKALKEDVIGESVGFGIVRAIDMRHRLLYIVTPLEGEVLKRVNCIKKGFAIDIPEEILIHQQCPEYERPYLGDISMRGVGSSLAATAGRKRKYYKNPVGAFTPK